MKNKNLIIIGTILSLSIIFALFFNYFNNKNEAKIYFNITVDKSWNKDSTPLVIHIKGDEKNKNSINEYRFINYEDIASNKSNPISLPNGNYEITYISSINNSGNIYSVHEEIAHKENIKINSNKDLKINIEYKSIPKEKIKIEDLENFSQEIKQISYNKNNNILKDNFNKLINTFNNNSQALKIELITKKAKSEGKSVYTGTIKIFKTNAEIMKFQIETEKNPEIISYLHSSLNIPEYTQSQYEEGPFVILDLGKTTDIVAGIAGAGFNHETRTRKGNSIRLSKDQNYWKKYEGKQVIVAVDTKKSIWPSDTSLPLGMARCSGQVIFEYDNKNNNLSINNQK